MHGNLVIGKAEPEDAICSFGHVSGENASRVRPTDPEGHKLEVTAFQKISPFSSVYFRPGPTGSWRGQLERICSVHIIPLTVLAVPVCLQKPQNKHVFHVYEGVTFLPWLGFGLFGEFFDRFSFRCSSPQKSPWICVIFSYAILNFHAPSQDLLNINYFLLHLSHQQTSN